MEPAEKRKIGVAKTKYKEV